MHQIPTNLQDGFPSCTRPAAVTEMQYMGALVQWEQKNNVQVQGMTYGYPQFLYWENLSLS